MIKTTEKTLSYQQITNIEEAVFEELKHQGLAFQSLYITVKERLIATKQWNEAQKEEVKNCISLLIASIIEAYDERPEE